MRIDVKICGLRTELAMESAIACGASHVGFIHFARSPRHVEPERAAELRQIARGKARAVVVTVNADDATLDRIVSTVEPDMLQLHGAEPPERVAALKSRYGLPIMKALAIRDAADLEPVRDFRGVADRLLFDAKAPADAAVPGGRGESFDWNLLAGLDPAIGYMLSGGLNADNVAAALAIARPKGIDVSSGVETAPGDKSPERIAEFFDALHRIGKPEGRTQRRREGKSG